MDNLKGNSILIGKDAASGRLCLVVGSNGAQAKTALLGQPGSVPACVSRCMPQTGVGHARLTVDNAGNMTLSNLKSQNVTFVNGCEIVSKKVTPDMKIELGMDRYRLDIDAILAAASKIAGATSPSQANATKFNIAHLERVWTDYHESIKALRERQKRVNLVRTGCGIFTMCAMPCIFMFGPVGYVLTAIGIAGNIYSFVGLKNDSTADEQEQLTERFQDSYVCPNPDCGKYLAITPYRLMKKQYSMTCPHCKCTFVEK